MFIYGLTRQASPIIAENVTSREFKMALIVVLQLYLPYRVGCVINGDWMSAQQAILNNWENVQTFMMAYSGERQKLNLKSFKSMKDEIYEQSSELKNWDWTDYLERNILPPRTKLLKLN